MQLRKTVVAIALGLGFAASAQAIEVVLINDLGQITTATNLWGTVEVGATGSGTEFLHEYTFTVAPDVGGVNTKVWEFVYAPGNGNGRPHLDLDWLTVSLVDSVGGTQSVEGWVQPGGFGPPAMGVSTTFNVDPSLSYTLQINGFASGAQGGDYNITFGGVAAVPEPAEYAMLLAGLGVVGMVARRRKMKQI